MNTNQTQTQTTSATRIGWPCDAYPMQADSRIQMDLTTAEVAAVARRKLLGEAFSTERPTLHWIGGHLVLFVVTFRWSRAAIDGVGLSSRVSLNWRDTCRRLVRYTNGELIVRALVAREDMLLKVDPQCFQIVGSQLHEITRSHHASLLRRKRREQRLGNR